MSVSLTPIPRDDIQENLPWRNWLYRLRIYILNLFSNTSSTATGGAAALPANPVGFIVVQINGVNYKVPYYNV